MLSIPVPEALIPLKCSRNFAKMAWITLFSWWKPSKKDKTSKHQEAISAQGRLTKAKISCISFLSLVSVYKISRYSQIPTSFRKRQLSEMQINRDIVFQRRACLQNTVVDYYAYCFVYALIFVMKSRKENKDVFRLLCEKCFSLSHHLRHLWYQATSHFFRHELQPLELPQHQNRLKSD